MMRSVGFRTHRLDDDQRKQLDRAVDYFNKAQKLVRLVDGGVCGLPTNGDCVDVRQVYALPPAETPLILVTGLPLSDNWFTHANAGLGLLTLADWEVAFIDQANETVNAAPDAHILTSLVLTGLLVLGELGDDDVLHEMPTGCLFDLCLHKPERILKMRAAFVCSTCTALLAQHGISSLDLDAAHSVLDCVRHLVLGRRPQTQLPDMPDVEALISDAGQTNKFRLPPRLVDACQRKAITLLVGSGLSLQSDVEVSYSPALNWNRLPTWAEVPIRMARCLEIYTGRKTDPRKTDTLDEFLADLDFFRESLGELLYYPRAIFDIFTPSVKSVGLLHRLIFRLPLSSILTTNYDFIMQCAAPVGSPVFTWREARAAREYLAGGGGHKPILKLHGCGSRPDTVVLTRLEYERLRHDEQYLSLLRSLFDHQTILFLGFGFNDPRDLDHILREAQLAGAATGEKFAVLPAQRCAEVRSKFPQVQTIAVHTHDELRSAIAALIVAAGAASGP
jgi:SIR2-like domain